MRVIYHCREGLFDSPIAAGIHLGLLPEDRPPKIGELRALPFYGRLERSPGRLYFEGADKDGNHIYTMGRRKVPDFVIKVLNGANRVLFENSDDLLFINCEYTRPFVSFYAKHIGNIDPHALGYVMTGSIRAFPHFIRVVRDAKRKMGYS